VGLMNARRIGRRDRRQPWADLPRLQGGRAPVSRVYIKKLARLPFGRPRRPRYVGTGRERRRGMGQRLQRGQAEMEKREPSSRSSFTSA